MVNNAQDDAPVSLHSRAASRSDDYLTYPLPSGRRTNSPRTLAKRAIEAAVVVCLTLFAVSAWNKAMSPKESSIAPDTASPFTLLIDQGEKFLVLPNDLNLENAPTSHQCNGAKGKVACFKLLPTKPAK